MIQKMFDAQYYKVLLELKVTFESKENKTVNLMHFQQVTC